MMQACLPVHCDLGESKPLGFQHVAETPEDPHMHAKVQNSNIFSPLYKNLSQIHNFEKLKVYPTLYLHENTKKKKTVTFLSLLIKP